jgi:hypothetical protein
MAPTPYFNEKGEVIPFAELMRLEKIDENTFRSTVSAYAPTGGENGAYGGHVYAQSVWAAAQTVKEGFIVHVCIIDFAPFKVKLNFVSRHAIMEIIPYCNELSNSIFRMLPDGSP